MRLPLADSPLVMDEVHSLHLSELHEETSEIVACDVVEKVSNENGGLRLRLLPGEV